MHESFEVKSSSGSYRITIASGSLEHATRTNPEALLLVDERLLGSLPTEGRSVIAVSATETSKSFENIAPIFLQLRSLYAQRNTHILAIGGGVIQDIATFTSSLYMRGLAWSYLPTTLLGMVDSCIGGKSAINVGSHKNLIGNFHPPQEIFIDPLFIRSLDNDQIIAGLCEAAKIAYAGGPDRFSEFLADRPAPGSEVDVLLRTIHRSLTSKKHFIEIDEFDQGVRLLLNFGHTFGHAIEASSGFSIAHGIAVGFGMLVAIRYAERQRLLGERGAVSVAQLITYTRMLLSGCRTAVSVLSDIQPKEFMRDFENDKKHTRDHYRIIVPSGSGELEIVHIPKTTSSRTEFMDCYRETITSLKNLTHPDPWGQGTHPIEIKSDIES